jgi:hypothetical protein
MASPNLSSIDRTYLRILVGKQIDAARMRVVAATSQIDEIRHSEEVAALEGLLHRLHDFA